MSEIKVNKVSPRSGTNTTLGNSGDTLTVNCGVTLNNAGIITTTGISGSGTIINNGTITSSIEGVISWDTTVKTANFNALVGNGYFVDTTLGDITTTLPASPVAADLISLKDYANTASTNNIIINANGNKIQGSVLNFLINVDGTAANFIYVDATQGWVLIDASNASNISEPQYIVASGGTVTCCGDFKVHTFTGPGTFTVTNAGNPLGSTVVDYMVVAGGGGGGGFTRGGGGGAGGFRESVPSPAAWTASPLANPGGALPVSVQGYPITVGGGGNAGSGSVIEQGSNGNNSVFSTITSAGGGGGGGGQPGSTSPTRDGLSGGSGGGGGSGGIYTALGGTGNTPPVAPSQGNDGGSQTGGANQGGAGGGGTTASGGPSPNVNPSPGANGGAGATTSISASPTTYAGGGAGGSLFACGGTSIGGTGGGGPAGTPGTINTGGGGGGGYPGCNVGSGGSGIVIIRYKFQ